ncbi:DUF2207 domain-containing protein [Adlercreutzia sp. ZJ141]|uniref:DUF2207 domain-containing protein n=1 Tax=Adlercreutzia sp. ZJ141 TaxID=2709406 RepID=UPI0013EC633F|nr:DUF2207 domain-containing protein [Adlercreutzia sp. ZJ141]
MQNTGHAQKTRSNAPDAFYTPSGERHIARRWSCHSLRSLLAACARALVSLVCAFALVAAAPFANGVRGELAAPADRGPMLLAAGQVAASRTVAYADAVASPSVSIDARVGADGSLHVVERRVLIGESGELSAVWHVEKPSDNAELAVNSVCFAAADSNGEAVGDWTELASTYFVVDWRKSGSPDADSFAVDNPQNDIYVFIGVGSGEGSTDDEDAEGTATAGGEGKGEGEEANRSAGEPEAQNDASAAAAPDAETDMTTVTADVDADSVGNETTDTEAADQELRAQEEVDKQKQTPLVVELDYTIVNGVAAYKDVGEVYWKYVSDKWNVASEQVTMTLTLPVPQGVSAVAGDNVHAWGHGPQSGTFGVNDDGTITYSADRVEAGQFAEARVTFPVGWLYDVSDEARAETGETMRLATALNEEDGWADQNSMRRLAELNRAAVSAIVCVIALFAAVVAYLAFGRERKPDFTGDYWCDMPDSNLHPALAGRLWRWNHPSRADFVATVMHLRNEGSLAWEWRADVAGETGAMGAAGEAGKASETTSGDQLVLRALAAPDTLSDPFDASVLSALFDVIAQDSGELTTADIRRFGEEDAHVYVHAMSTFNNELGAEIGHRGYFDERSRAVQKAVLIAALVVFAGGIALSLLAGSMFPAVFAVPTALAMAVLGNYLPRRSVSGNNLVARCKALRNWLLEFGDRGESLSDAVVDWRLLVPYAYQFGVLDAAVANAWGSDDARKAADYARAADELQRSLDEAMHAARAALSSERSSFGGDTELNTWPQG